MNIIPNEIGKKRRKSDSKPHIQLNKCLNEKRRREQENVYIEELAELISASLSDMSSLSVKPDKCAILQETVKQIRIIKQQDCEPSDDLQASEVSSSRPTILANEVLGPLLLEALDGFLFIVNTDGIIEFVSENVTSFLKYAQSELVGKSIYDIIHTGDHPRFSSNLLPMSAIGNGFGAWSDSQASTSSTTASQPKSRSFNSRFMVKPREDDENSSDCDDSDSEFRSLMKSATSSKTLHSAQQYENMQISAVLVPPLESKRNSPGNSTTSEDNSLVCVARRIPVSEKSSSSVGVEQFTTRLDLTGKILAIDTSGVSSTYSQYLNKDLVGKMILELCHPNDLPRVTQHLKETLSTGSNVVSNIYRLMMANDKYVHVQTKSKMFNGNSSDPSDNILAIHSIIRDSETSASEASSRGGTPSPITTTTWIGNPTFSGTIQTGNNNGGNLISSLNSNLLTGRQTPCSTISTSQTSTGPVIYANTQTGMMSTTPFPTFSALSPSNVTEFSLNDCLGLSEMFPSSSVSWDNYDTNSQEATTSGATTSTPTFTSSSPVYTPVQTPPAMVTAASRQSPVCASSPSVANLVRSPSSTSSPQAGTPFNHSSSFDNKMEEFSPSSGSSQPHKLRSLLTHGMSSSEEADSSPVIKKEPGLTSANDNILRELLDQDDDAEMGSVAGTPAAPTSVNPPATPSSFDASGPGSVGSDNKKVANNNNMLRMLLNDDDVGKTREFRKNQDLLEVLLKDDNREAFLTQFKKEQMDSAGSTSSSLPSSINEVMAGSSMANKRKSIDETSTHYETQDMKRPASVAGSTTAQHLPAGQQLAGQNPMLASMLARTPTSVPEAITIPTSIISQTPQDKLPRNLEKKLIPTPVHQVSGIQLVQQPTGNVTQSGGLAIVTTVAAQTPLMVPISVSAVNTQQIRPQIHQLQQIQPQQRLQIQPQPQPTQSLQQQIQAHQQQQEHVQQIQVQAIPQSQVQQQQQQQQQQAVQTPPQSASGPFLNRILSDGSQVVVNRTLAQPIQSPQIQVTPFYQQSPQPPAAQPVATQVVATTSIVNQSGFEETNASDPYLSSILDDFINMQQEMNLDPPSRAARANQVSSINEDTMLLKLLEEVIEPTAPNVATPSTPSTPVDINERMAISAIQKQLMSFEVTTPTSPNAMTTPFTTAPPNYQQIPPPAYTAPNYGQQMGSPQATFQLQPRAPATRLQQTRPYLPQNVQVNPALAQVASRAPGLNNMLPAMRSKLQTIDRKKLILLEQQKRLLAQQSQQQMIPQTQQPSDSVTFGAFPENMNDLLNNTVAPNVAVKPRPGPPTPEGAQLSPRYTIPMNVSSPLPQSPAPQQLSPGPRQPFSPVPAQQSYPSPQGATYPNPQHRMSPHFVPSPASAQGPNSPLMQMSPQTSNWSQQVVRPQQMATTNQQVMQQSSQNVSIQQTNPMLNAQLSGNGPSYPANGQRFQQRPMREVAPRPARPFPEQFRQAPFAPLAPQTGQRPRMPVTTLPSRVNSPRFSNDTSLPSPGYQTVSYTQSDQFTFEQTFTQSSGQSNDRTRNNSGMTSEYVKQELRAMVNTRTQQQQQMQQQPPQQQLPQTLSDLEMFGLSLDTLADGSVLGGNSSDSDFTQGLLNIADPNLVNSPHLNMPRSNSMDDSKPNDQKKSLLQQLLSEPS